MRARPRFSDAAVALVACAMVAAALATLHVPHLMPFFAFAALVAISELFEVVLPNDTVFSPGLAPALGYMLLGGKAVSECLVLLAVGMIGATVLRALMHRPLRVSHSFAQMIALGAGTVVYNAIGQAGTGPSFNTDFTDISVAGFAALLVTVTFVKAALQAFEAASQDGRLFTPLFVAALRLGAPLRLSILSVAALLALSYPTLGYWSFPLLLAPLAATQFAFRQFASIRKTYLQTVRALAKVPEMAGYTQPGHSARVAGLSVAIARELGVDEEAVIEIEYAALLHDIGTLSIPDTEDVSQHTSRMELALVGAAIVRETGHFQNVAEMIEHQHDPYRRRGEDRNHALPTGATIIKVASAYDDFTNPGGVGLSTWDALERLHSGTQNDYDPLVIQALTRVLEKRGTI
jgi:putative nucleotidyltransferase with HDIG domain